MQANYPKKLPRSSWDTNNLEYPVKKFPGTGLSSETIGRKWRPAPEVMSSLKVPVPEITAYGRDFNVTNKLTQSQTTVDFGFKYPETRRHNKHTSCNENLYIYPPSRKLTDRPPQCTAHGTTEMRSAYTPPTISSRLVTDKDQFKHPASLPPDLPEIELSWHKELEPLDTTHEGFEKYLDPYLTTSRLHHRPYTADQLNRPSATKDIVTYYTYAKDPWVHTRKPEAEEWRLPLSIRPKSMYDREKFKQDFREIRTHNKLSWVPGSFRTEVRDNYVQQTSRPESQIHNAEENIRTFYKRSIATLPTTHHFERSTIQKLCATENSQVGFGRPLCSVIDQYIEKNKRLERKSIRIG